jgi:hypothetical protein
MEAKVPGNEPSPIQIRRMKELAAAGCLCAVVFSEQDARKFLEECV